MRFLRFIDFAQFQRRLVKIARLRERRKIIVDGPEIAYRAKLKVCVE